MANIATSEIVFISTDKAELKSLHDAMKENLWVGEILKERNIDPETVVCRSTILYVDDGEGLETKTVDGLYFPEGEYYFKIGTSDAWETCTNAWDKICGTYHNMEYVYRCEEGGCDYFVNSDSSRFYLPEEYYVEVVDEFGDYVESEYFDSDEDLLDYARLYEFDYDYVDELMERMDDEDLQDSVHLLIHKFEDVE